MRSRPQSRTAIACLGIIAAASLLAMAPARAHGTGPALAGASPHVIKTIPLTRQPFGLAVDPVTDMIYVTEPAQLQVIDGNTDTVVATVHRPASRPTRGPTPSTRPNQAPTARAWRT